VIEFINYLGIDLKVKITNEGVHSGDGSGVIPDTLRIIRQVIEFFSNFFNVFIAP